MKIGLLKENKANEGRVALLPSHVRQLVEDGHKVIVQAGAGKAAGHEDARYVAAGASISLDREGVFARCDMLVKVKELTHIEYPLLRRNHIVVANLHTAGDRYLTDALLASGCTAISIEECHEFGSTNCVTAGEIAALEAVHHSLQPFGGPGRHFAHRFGERGLIALVMGIGQTGRGVIRVLESLGVTVFAYNRDRERREAAQLDFPRSGFFHIRNLPNMLHVADLIFNCTLWEKGSKDHLITRSMLRGMKPTTLIVDVSCDAAGAIETSRPTNWYRPIYREEGIRHWCVDNIGGAVPVSSSRGYADGTIHQIRAIADLGPIEACRRSQWLAKGLTCDGGTLLFAETARVQERPYTHPTSFLARRAE